MQNREPSRPKKIITTRRGKPFKTWLIYYKLDGKECRFTSVSKDKVDAKVKQVKEQIEHNGDITKMMKDISDYIYHSILSLRLILQLSMQGE